jgi:hypothetical protein
MADIGTLRFVVGTNSRLEFLTSSGAWEKVAGVKSVHPLADISNPEDPTLGRVELRTLAVVSESAAAPPSPS